MVVHNFKCVVIGDSGVGKTSLLTRFVKEEFRGGSGTRSTISAAFLERRVDLGGGDAAHLEIWDTAGQERFRSLNTPMYYRGAAGAVLVYDATNSESFAHVPGWYSQLRMMGERNCIVALCASKLDLAAAAAATQGGQQPSSAAASEQQRDQAPSSSTASGVVDAREARSFAAKNGIPVFRETSAKTGHNVEDLFVSLARVMVEAKAKSAGGDPARRKDGAVKLEMPPARHGAGGACC